MSRNHLTEAEAHELMSDDFPSLVEVFLKSKDALNKRILLDFEMGVTNHTSKVKAMDMWHYAMNFSSQMFADHPNFKPGFYNQVYGLVYHEAMFIRFKKLNDQFQTANIPTIQSSAIDNQSSVGTFPAKPCILTVGYISDVTGVGFKSINLICSKKKKVIWNINLLDAQSTNIELPFTPDSGPVSPSVEKLLIIKEGKKKKNNKIG